MFQRLDLSEFDTSFRFGDTTVPAREGENLAAAMLRAGIKAFRSTPRSGASRGPYCMMGVCFECLVTVDGRPNRQACLETVRAGMVVEPQAGAAEIRR
ncbi:(2Fe-2S)-binding protein [Bosea sp. F3-2]|uniref:(2Fe-2S)-binding protein n=1 Tax=Bosea sp. F3-2 TaxID=2599640 RepID=UPI0011EF990F|nr:(2Fe-2S)-binding protein [Bosea sp. F3-2]QEL25396.1 (2Fe-2S)-binding protein [Bosea sp. F3-2]